MKRVIILQARMGSTRLPGKVLKPILGKPLLYYQIERLQHVSNCDELIVATSTNPGDNPIADLCQEMGIKCYRGDEEDVLERYYQAAKHAHADMVVRITGDCPLIDPEVVSDIMTAFEAASSSSQPADFLSNTLHRTYPRGLDTEVFSFGALETAWREAKDLKERMHVTAFIYLRPERFRLQSFRQEVNRSQLRWTVDVPEDFELIEKILSALYPDNPTFSQEDVMRLLKAHPAWFGINSHIEQLKPFTSPSRCFG